MRRRVVELRRVSFASTVAIIVVVVVIIVVAVIPVMVVVVVVPRSASNGGLGIVRSHGCCHNISSS